MCKLRYQNWYPENFWWRTLVENLGRMQSHPLIILILLPVRFSFQSCDVSLRLSPHHLLGMPWRATPRQHRFTACKKLNVALARPCKAVTAKPDVDVDELKFHSWNVVCMLYIVVLLLLDSIELFGCNLLAFGSWIILAISTILVRFWPSLSLIWCD